MYITLKHFSYKNKDYVWATYEYGDALFVSGYIPNIWEFDELDNNQIEVDLVKPGVYLEHYNGGRTNCKEYDTIEAYLNCDFAKECYNKWLEDNSEWKFEYEGTPSNLDYIMTFNLVKENQVVTLKDIIYDIKIPEHWYKDRYKDVLVKLEEAELYENQDDVDVIIRDDLFGKRYFPVVLFPDETVFVTLCKTWSSPLHGERGVYYGLRVTSHDVEYIHSVVYGNNGKVLKGVEWDWS